MEDWKKKIEDSAKDLEVPDSLQPQKVQERLEGKRRVSSFRRRPVFRTLTAAAAIVLVLAGAWGLQRMGILSLGGDLSSGSSGASAAYGTTAASNEEAAADTTADTEAASDATAEDMTEAASDAGAEGAAPETASDAAAEESEHAGTSIAEDDAAADAEEAEAEEPDESFGEYYHTFSYKKLKNKLRKVWEEQQAARAKYEEYDGTVCYDSAESASGSSEAAADTGGDTSSSDYSSTNLQVAGVDEGDIVKTDGTYLYILSSGSGVRIVEAKGLEVVSEIPMELDGESADYQEMFLDGDRLILVGDQSSSSLGAVDEDVYYVNNVSQTVMATYDLSDIEKPELLGKVSQDGYYRTSRKVGNYLYLFSDYYYYGDEEFDENRVIPKVNGAVVPEDQIYVPDEIQECKYLVMSSVNVENPDRITDSKALLNSGGQFYITKSSIYVIRYEGAVHWYQNQRYSSFIRFKMNKGNIQAVAAALLKGELTDTFAVSESGGYLRTFLTDWSGSETVNRVYVLNGNMKVCGTIEDLAPGETIYSARFMGNKGYFVTYRNIDPLFSVDFSDPENPEIMGALKVSGFSEYLHFYGNGKLLGLGWETDPDTGETLGLKLSMYDIRNPKQVTEENKLVIKGVANCDALYNYKAVLADPEKNLIGFAAGFYTDDSYQEKYIAFSYDQTEGFVKKLEFNLGEAYDYGYGTVRGAYIGDALYVAEQDRVTAFDMKNQFEKMGSLELAEKR